MTDTANAPYIPDSNTAPEPQTVHVDPAYRTSETGITIICPECGDLLEVHDPRSLILTLHQRNECPQTSGLFGHGSGE